MDWIILLLLSIAPPVAFLIYVLWMDRAEPEPMGYILYVLILGGLACFPAALLEIMMGGFALFQMGGFAGAFFKSFIQIAPVEELLKLMIVLLFVWKNKNFNEENDGIVYVGTAAIGFAMMENVFYVMGSGIAVGTVRAMTAIPLHTFTGIIMGYYVGLAKFTSGKNASGLIIKGLMLAYLFHGVYDTFALSNSILALLIFPLIIILTIIGIRRLKLGRQLSIQRLQRTDRTSKTLYPEDKFSDGTAAYGEQALSKRKNTLFSKNSAGPYLWRIIVSRFLFALSGIFWMLLTYSLFDKNVREPLSIFDFFVGGTICTIIPIIIGIMLEVSYARRKQDLSKSST